ncbi:copper resistance protein NlpE N-terminal domain-containing protein [Hymenobacter weizhouensis]|uniref:copper resistance protein NlpE N-terminal domain-containing protein n=1 Tax=Hymenobacter sp. YIM 151500-1 TaxID=2987689 RepID=UPI0022274B33|nr:copper resistance protein NlpE N-terminal domain-containing protein [Hymenobacter sp. YIM 151500-1]UYZ62703.1 copper resistance protein NlpE N-terminal domain-containing protein [Hymenobacter sp. YIM 151500-1]
MRRRLFLLPLIVLGLAGGRCSPKATEPTTATPPPAPPAPADPARLGGTWLVVRLNGQPVPAPAEARLAPQLVFDAEQGRVSGFTGCNRLMGSYTVAGSTIRFGQVASTRMACAGPNAEPELLATLNTTEGLTYELSGDAQLTLRQGSTPVLELSRAVDPAHNSRNSLDWAGTYSGTLPCADCPGIRTELTLNQDLTYRLRTLYLGKGTGKPIEATGVFRWDDAGRTVRLPGLDDQPAHYLVGENQLIQLDKNGQRITGSLAEKYVLRKQ